MKIILLGAPGSGKGTQAKLLIEKLGIPHISTGDIFRKAISEGTEAGLEAKYYLDNGLLCPDEVTCKIVKERIMEDDCKNGFLFDGFPRTVNQAIELEKFSEIDDVIYLEVDESVLIDRVVGREVCPNCGASYHYKHKPSKVNGVCDLCGANLVKRKDDNEETLKERLNAYNTQTAPLINYYKEKNLLRTINALQDIDEVTKSILEALNND